MIKIDQMTLEEEYYSFLVFLNLFAIFFQIHFNLENAGIRLA